MMQMVASKRLFSGAVLATGLWAVPSVPADAAPASAATTRYHVTMKFQIGGDAYWDYLVVDSAARRLYLPHATKVEVLDLESGKVLGQVENTPGVHGVAIVNELGKGFASNGKAGTVTVFDLKTFAHLAEIKAGTNPDAIVYDPGTRRVFVSNNGGGDLTVIEAETAKVAGTVAVGGVPEFSAADQQGTLWVNLEDKNALVTVDAKALKVKRTTPLPGCEAPASMAMDRPNRRLFIGCKSRSLLVVDADTGSVITKFPIGEHPDATVFDPDSRQVFTSTGDGKVTIVRQDSPDKYSVVATVPTMRGAKTMALDPKTKRIFLPTVENVPATATGPPRSGAGAYTPGPFVVLVLEP